MNLVLFFFFIKKGWHQSGSVHNSMDCNKNTVRDTPTRVMVMQAGDMEALWTPASEL